MDGCYQLKDVRIKTRLETKCFIIDDVDAKINSVR